MATRFEAFGNNSIYTSRLRFLSENDIGNDMNHLNTVLFKQRCPFFWTASRSKHNGDFFIQNRLNMRFYTGV
jgi:hypothetical protein